MKTTTLSAAKHGARARVWRNALVIWLVIVAVETLHGILRMQFLVQVVGELHAGQLGVVTGSLLNFGITWFSIRWIGARTMRLLLAVGLAWLALMLLFELGLGRLVLRVSWTRILADYDPRRGGLLMIGMLFLACSPLLAARLRGIRAP